MRALLCAFSCILIGGCAEVFFIEDPSNTFGLENQKISLRCVYKSEQNNTLTWYRNNLEVNMDTREYKQSIKKASDGTTSASLTFHLLRHNEGEYYCNISVNGNWTSSHKAAARIAFLGEQFVLEPQDKTVSVGETVLLECIPPIGSPKPIIHWYKNNISVRSDERTQVSETGSLRIDRVSWKDGGSYMCVAETFAFRRRSSIAKLTVRQRPYFVESPLSQSVGIHDSFELSCRAAGEPMPVIFWRREPSFLEIPFDRTRLTLRGTLQFLHARLEDAGDYVCRAVSSSGVIEAVARITIVSPPGLIQTSPGTLSVLEGERVELLCGAVGSPDPEVRWIRQNPVTYYISGSENSIERIFTTRTGALVILVARLEDTSDYECRASSSAGLTRSVTHLEVVENPYMYPARFGALSSGRVSVRPSESPARIICEFPVTNSSPSIQPPTLQQNIGVSNSQGLSIAWRVDGASPLERFADFNRTFVEQTGSLVIQHIRKQDEGNYTCLIFNHISRRYTSWTTQLLVDISNADIEHHSQTKSISFTETPFNLTVLDIGDTWLLLQWSDVPVEQYEYLGYRIFYLPIVSGSPEHVPTPAEPMALDEVSGTRKPKSKPTFDAWLTLPDLLQQRQVRLTKLLPNTGYWIEVRKVFKFGYSAGALLPHIVYTLTRPSGIQMMETITARNSVSSDAESILSIPFSSGSSAADFQGLLSNFQTINFQEVSVRSLTSTELLMSWITRSSSDILQQIDGFKVNIKPVPMSRCLSTATSSSTNKLSLSYTDGHVPLEFPRRSDEKVQSTSPMHCSLSSDDLLERIMRTPNGPTSSTSQHTYRNDIASLNPSPRTLFVFRGTSTSSITRVVGGGLIPFTCYELDVEAFRDDVTYGRILSPASRPELALTLDAPPSHAPKLVTADWIFDSVNLDTNFTSTVPHGVRLSWSPLELRLSHGALVGYVVHLLSNETDHSRSLKVPADVHTRDVFGLDPYVEYTIYLAGVTCRGEGVRGPGYRLSPASSLFQHRYADVAHSTDMLSTNSKFPSWGYGIIIGVIVFWIFFGSLIPLITRRGPSKQPTDSTRPFDSQNSEMSHCWPLCIFRESNKRPKFKPGTKAPTIDNPLTRRSDSNASYSFATAVHRDQVELANLLQRKSDSHHTSGSDQPGTEIHSSQGDSRIVPAGYSTSGSNSRGDPSIRQLPVQPEGHEKSNYLAADDAEVYANSDPSLDSDPVVSPGIQNSTSPGPMYHPSLAAAQSVHQAYRNRGQLPESVNVPFPVQPGHTFVNPASPTSLSTFPAPDFSSEVTSGFISNSGRPSHETFTQLNGSDHHGLCTEDSVPPYASCTVLSAPRLHYNGPDFPQPYNLGSNKLTDRDTCVSSCHNAALMSQSVSGKNASSNFLEPMATKQWPITSRAGTQTGLCVPYTTVPSVPHSIPPPPEYPPPPLPSVNQWMYPVHQNSIYPHSTGTGNSSNAMPEYDGQFLLNNEAQAFVPIEPGHHYSSSGIYAQTEQGQPTMLPYLNNGLHPGSRFPLPVETSTYFQQSGLNPSQFPLAELHPSGLLKLDQIKARSGSTQRQEKSASTRGGTSSTGGGGSSSGRSTASGVGAKQYPRPCDPSGAVSSLSGSDSYGSGHRLVAMYPNSTASSPHFPSTLSQSPMPASAFSQQAATGNTRTVVEQSPSVNAMDYHRRDHGSCSPHLVPSVNKTSRHISEPPNHPPSGNSYSNSLIVCNPRHTSLGSLGFSPAARPPDPSDIGA